MNVAPTSSDRSIFIYGMMLAGKSSVGKKVAEILNLEFIDLDDVVIRYLKDELGFDSIGDFIAVKTEELGSAEDAWNCFAEIENICLKRILEGDEQVVISSGGRTMFNEKNRQLVSETQNLVTFYLEIEIEEQIRRSKDLKEDELIHRPALKGDTSEFFTSMQDDRRGIYDSVEGKETVKVGGKEVHSIAAEIIERAA